MSQKRKNALYEYLFVPLCLIHWNGSISGIRYILFVIIAFLLCMRISFSIFCVHFDFLSMYVVVLDNYWTFIISDVQLFQCNTIFNIRNNRSLFLFDNLNKMPKYATIKSFVYWYKQIFQYYKKSLDANFMPTVSILSFRLWLFGFFGVVKVRLCQHNSCLSSSFTWACQFVVERK